MQIICLLLLLFITYINSYKTGEDDVSNLSNDSDAQENTVLKSFNIGLDHKPPTLFNLNSSSIFGESCPALVPIEEALAEAFEEISAAIIRLKNLFTQSAENDSSDSEAAESPSNEEILSLLQNLTLRARNDSAALIQEIFSILEGANDENNVNLSVAINNANAQLLAVLNADPAPLVTPELITQLLGIVSGIGPVQEANSTELLETTKTRIRAAIQHFTNRILSLLGSLDHRVDGLIQELISNLNAGALQENEAKALEELNKLRARLICIREQLLEAIQQIIGNSDDESTIGIALQSYQTQRDLPLLSQD